MTPKEKAKELMLKYEKYFNNIYTNFKAQRCALIAVDEILKMKNTNTYNYLTENKEQLIVQLADSYWLEVKKEIEKL
jgi:hypothetical protein